MRQKEWGRGLNTSHFALRSVFVPSTHSPHNNSKCFTRQNSDAVYFQLLFILCFSTVTQALYAVVNHVSHWHRAKFASFLSELEGRKRWAEVVSHFLFKSMFGEAEGKLETPTLPQSNPLRLCLSHFSFDLRDLLNRSLAWKTFKIL